MSEFLLWYIVIMLLILFLIFIFGNIIGLLMIICVISIFTSGFVINYCIGR